MRARDIYDSYFEVGLGEISAISEVERVAELTRNARAFWATGLGKSGLAAQKFVGTMRSLGRNAHYIHPVDGLHGDSGAIFDHDVVIAISASGETEEIIEFMEKTRRTGVNVGVIGNECVPLEEFCHHILFTAGPQWDAGHVPSASFVTACCVLDMLAVSIAGENARIRHPGGSIGRRLGT